MKRFFTSILVIITGLNVFAQTTISDSVSLGAGYANDVYYSTQTFAKSSVPNNNWELAFNLGTFDVAIFANHINGVTVYQCPNTNAAGFATLDTTGLSTWQVLNNTDTSWSTGALNVNIATSNPYDFGWGIYNPSNHTVNGDSLFVIKLTTMGFPDEYRKLFIQQKTLAGDYIIHYSNLDNTNDVNTTIYKSNYVDKNFGYYSLRNNVALDREPITLNWDLLFTRYFADIGGGVYYPTTGVLSNIDVQSAEARHIDLTTVDPANYVNLYTDNISEIGYDWKTFNGSSYVIEDSLCYFINSQNGNISKIIFTGFGGAADGNIFFNLTNYPTAINEFEQAQLKSMALYPNVTTDNSTLVFNNKTEGSCDLSVYSISGNKVMQQNFDATSGLNKKQLNVSDFSKGIYLVKLTNGNESLVQKLIVQ
ncbi:MAG: T9SS type A sorting domain-containing protein [Bacteroidia bacterium]